MSEISFYRSWREFFCECWSLKLDLEIASGLDRPIDGIKKAEKIAKNVKTMLINIFEEIIPYLKQSDAIKLLELEGVLLGELDEINQMIEKFKTDQTPDILPRTSSAKNFWIKMSSLYERWLHFMLEQLEPFRVEVYSLLELRHFTIECNTDIPLKIKGNEAENSDIKGLNLQQPMINQDADKLSQNHGNLNSTGELVSGLYSSREELNRAHSDYRAKYGKNVTNSKSLNEARVLMKINCNAKEAEAIRSLMNRIGISKTIETESCMDSNVNSHKKNLKVTPVPPKRKESHSLDERPFKSMERKISSSLSSPLDHLNTEISMKSNQSCSKELPPLPKLNIMEAIPNPSSKPQKKPIPQKSQRRWFVKGRKPEKPIKELEISLPYQIEHKSHATHDFETGKLILKNWDLLMKRR